jgi:hypothetical protein
MLIILQVRKLEEVSESLEEGIVEKNKRLISLLSSTLHSSSLETYPNLHIQNNRRAYKSENNEKISQIKRFRSQEHMK